MISLRAFPPTTRTPVVGLLLAGRPAAVRRAISLVIVDSIKRQSRRAFTHVSKEVFKHLPPLANSDTTLRVVFRFLRAIAARSHKQPRAVSRCAGLTVSSISLAGRLGVVAAARERSTSSQRLTLDDTRCSTGAKAGPHRLSVWTAGRAFYNGPSSKYLPGDVDHFHGVP